MQKCIVFELTLQRFLTDRINVNVNLMKLHHYYGAQNT